MEFLQKTTRIKVILLHPLILTLISFFGKNGPVDVQVKDNMDVNHTLKKTKKELIEEIDRLKQSEEKYRTMLDSSSDPIFCFSAEGIYLYVNKAFADGVGRPVEEIIDHPIYDVFPRFEAEKRFETVRWVIENKETRIQEFRVPRPDGDRTYLTTARPVMDEHNQVRMVLCISKDITERKRMEEQLFSLSTRDVLTGLYNRNFFEVELERLQLSRMFPVSIIVADMDNLKGINDRFGHLKGDEVLKTVAGCFKEAFRAEEIIARIGGDEFGVLLPNTDSAPANEAITRLKLRLASVACEYISLSIGMATSHLEEELSHVLKRADDLMYREKMSKRVAAGRR